MKTETTKKLEKLLENHFNQRKDFYVFECTIGWYGKEIVDCIMYDTNRITYCYEIKQSKADFHSKNALTFIGNKNYFVMPYSLYLEVKDEIPLDIGVYASLDRVDTEVTKTLTGTMTAPIFVSGFNFLQCVKPAKLRELRADKEVILSSMLRSMQRDVGARIRLEEL